MCIRDSEERPGELTIRFTISRGPRYTVESIDIEGNASVPTSELTPIVRVKAGEPFVQAQVDAAAAGIRGLYRSRGYESVVVEPRVTPADGETRANVLFAITEGPQVIVDHVIIVGNRRTR